MLLTHRYYDPAEGRFLTRDPIGYAGGLNLYAYCGNNPVGRSDPSGLLWGAEDWANYFDAYGSVKPVYVDGIDALLIGNAEFWSGIGDHISFGATKYVRAQLGRDDYASSKSRLHKAGLYAGYAWDAAFTYASAGAFNGIKGGIPHYIRFLKGELKVNPYLKESHHLLPRQLNYNNFFKNAGLDIEEYTIKIPRWKHRLKNTGIHPKWNKKWIEFESKNTNASKEKILQFLENMKNQFRL